MNNSLSPGSSCIISSSILALTTITSDFSLEAYCQSFFTADRPSISFPRSASSIFAAYMTGLAESKKSSPIIILSSSLNSIFLIGIPFTSSSFTLPSSSYSVIYFFSPLFAILCALSILFSRLSRSARINSRFTTSTSLTGSISGYVCDTFSSLKHLTT
ncbi:hypothetical protein ES708_22432 [subsurface metagenome]